MRDRQCISVVDGNKVKCVKLLKVPIQLETFSDFVLDVWHPDAIEIHALEYASNTHSKVRSYTFKEEKLRKFIDEA